MTNARTRLTTAVTAAASALVAPVTLASVAAVPLLMAVLWLAGSGGAARADSEPIGPPFWLAPTMASQARQDHHILYIPIPPDLSEERLVSSSQSVRSRLDRPVQEALAKESGALAPTEGMDRIIVFVDQAGIPILPDLDAARSAHGPDSAALVVATTAANELTFTYDSPNYPWSDQELLTLNTVLGDCYPIAKNVYGNPAFNITVNVSKNPTLTVAGTYDASTNEMTLNNASRLDPICHEMIHAFRDDDIVGLSSYEEGMTRAAEVEVFNRLPVYTNDDENHSYPYDVYYDALNRQKIGSRYGDLWLHPALAYLRYQLSGYAWAKALIENPNFLADFNRELYARTLSDSSTSYTESKLLDIATTVQSTVEGKPFLTWYGEQGVLNTQPPNGYFLYQRINSLPGTNSFTIDYFFRDPSGSETMQDNATIQWYVYDYQDILLDSGSDVTGAYGWISVNPTLPDGYFGRINVVATANSPGGMISNRTPVFAGSSPGPSPSPGATPSPCNPCVIGIFGVVPEANEGTITITPLDDPTSSQSVPVVHGSFAIPSFAAVRGRFLVHFEDSELSFSRQITKDASDYFVLMDGPVVVGNVDCNNAIDSVDALKELRFTAGLPVMQTQPCPMIGSEVASIWGDVDCDGDVDSVDALKILRFVAQLSVSQTEPCPDIGAPEGG